MTVTLIVPDSLGSFLPETQVKTLYSSVVALSSIRVRGPNFGQSLDFGQGFLNSVRLYFRAVRRYKWLINGSRVHLLQLGQALRLT
jgi:hypothetical protein